jgi:hypothetical protein
LSFFQTLEAQTLQRCFLRVADARLDFALAQSSQLHMIRSIYIRFASPTPFIRCAASVFRS